MSRRVQLLYLSCPVFICHSPLTLNKRGKTQWSVCVSQSHVGGSCRHIKFIFNDFRPRFQCRQIVSMQTILGQR